MLNLRLLWAFFKIGLFSIGGGLATLPYLFELCNQHFHLTKSRLIDMIAISQCTPGPVGINMATYVGMDNGGVVMAVLTSLALILPSFIIIVLIAKGLKKFENNQFIQKLFNILRPCAIGFMIAAYLNIVKVGITSYLDIFIVIGLVILYIKKPMHPLFFLSIAGVIGILISR